MNRGFSIGKIFGSFRSCRMAIYWDYCADEIL
jgi:hypothetical protein